MARNIIFIFAIILLLIWGAYLLYGNQLQELATTINFNNSWEYHYYDKSVYNLYENQEYHVDFLYPKDYQELQGLNFDFVSNNILTVIAVPPEYFSNTNLSEAYFILGANKDQDIIEKCLNPLLGETKAGTKQIHDDIFHVYKTLDAAVGNIYETTSYRLVKNETCYEAITYLHYGNYEIYDPSLGIEEFDKIDINNKLLDILMKLDIE